MKVKDFHDFLSSLGSGGYYEEGIHYGNAELEVRGVLVCWMSNLRAIEAAVKKQCNLIVAHEELFFSRPTAPPDRTTSASTVGLPRESRTSLPQTNSISNILQPPLREKMSNKMHQVPPLLGRSSLCVNANLGFGAGDSYQDPGPALEYQFEAVPSINIRYLVSIDLGPGLVESFF